MRTGILHVHSDYSRDGRDPLSRVREFALDRGVGFVGLTDHAEDFVSELFEEYVRECESLSDERVQLIPGLEFRFKGHTGLHLLALGLQRWIEPTTPGEFVRDARGNAGLTIMAHPVLASYLLPDEVAAGIHAIEVWNASYNTRYLPDTRAIALLRSVRSLRPDVVGIAGLDQHDASNDRETRVILEHDGADALMEVRSGRFTNVGRTMRFDSVASMSPTRFRALSAARWAFDHVERTQERLARALVVR